MAHSAAIRRVVVYRTAVSSSGRCVVCETCLGRQAVSSSGNIGSNRAVVRRCA